MPPIGEGGGLPGLLCTFIFSARNHHFVTCKKVVNTLLKSLKRILVIFLKAFASVGATVKQSPFFSTSQPLTE
jgi:hypothetical protein